MKKLVVVRHAKSSWKTEGIHDIDRPLKKRGVFDAYNVATQFVPSGNVPDQVITSPASRALHTCSIITRVLNFPLDKIGLSEKLYFSGVKSIVEVIKEADPSLKTLMIVGHNPDLSGLVNFLTDEELPDMRTSEIRLLTSQADTWTEAVVENWKFEEKWESSLKHEQG